MINLIYTTCSIYMLHIKLCWKYEAKIVTIETMETIFVVDSSEEKATLLRRIGSDIAEKDDELTWVFLFKNVI